MTNKDLIIFILSFGRKKVPTLKHIHRKEEVIVLTSEDNKYKNEIDTQGAKLMIFNKDDFKYRGLEMMNEESVPQKRSAVYAYNYAIEYGRENGYKYVLVLDDDYHGVESINKRLENKPKIDLWALHAVDFLKKYPLIGATCAINNGQLFANATKAYLSNLKKRQLMNTIIFNTQIKHYFNSLGNGDYCDMAALNTYSTSLVVRLQTIRLRMETIDDKRHETIDYSNLFYSRWSAKMISPAYTRIYYDKTGGKGFKGRANTHYTGNSAPKIVSL